ncbi:hypothetical protein [[Mycobacterium] crassicus]|uniref:HK97 gp10 family phage protein n=1 Tax=[Mycobacterium] crassicus TaxID=2872309 RepID=A0ABU5XNR1_9MYCO|nr:hypothetical protein [Mycolicibacter sp. MYC098]MEB3023918.1 hypothetical protein [Mycolicibacter sp. MYC098]
MKLDERAMKQEIEKKVLKSIETKAAVIETAKSVQQHWRDLIPSSDAPAHALRKGSDHVYEPGDAKKSIRVAYRDKDGEFSARVESKNPVVRWLEYGTSKIAERGYAARTVEEFGGKVNEEEGSWHVGTIGE